MKTVLLEWNPPAALITLNRPDVRNALSPELIEETRGALRSIAEHRDTACVIVTGAGTAFSAGADLYTLRAMTAQSAEEARRDTLDFMRFFRDIYEFPKPVIAAVNGPAVGGGCGLASVCDIVLAAEEAIFGYTEAKVGFIPALVAVFLVRICGEKKAGELLLTGRTFSASEALEIGLINGVVPRDGLMARAQEMAQTISENSPTSVALTKKLLRDIQGLSLHEALSLAVEVNASVRSTENFREGVSAFLEKRKANWKIP